MRLGARQKHRSGSLAMHDSICTHASMRCTQGLRRWAFNSWARCLPEHMMPDKAATGRQEKNATDCLRRGTTDRTHGSLADVTNCKPPQIALKHSTQARQMSTTTSDFRLQTHAFGDTLSNVEASACPSTGCPVEERKANSIRDCKKLPVGMRCRQDSRLPDRLQRWHGVATLPAQNAIQTEIQNNFRHTPPELDSQKVTQAPARDSQARRSNRGIHGSTGKKDGKRQQSEQQTHALQEAVLTGVLGTCATETHRPENGTVGMKSLEATPIT